MIHPIELRPGNYIHPALPADTAVADTARYLRIIGVDLESRTVKAKQDHQSDITTLDITAIFPCSLKDLMRQIGGMGFGEHSIILKSEHEVMLMLANTTPVSLDHIQYLHQFQNLVRSLTGQELGFNVAADLQ